MSTPSSEKDTGYVTYGNDLYTAKYIPPHRRDREQLKKAVVMLDVVEIEQCAQYTGLCPVCNTPYYGILDEAKVTLPLYNVGKYLLRDIDVLDVEVRKYPDGYRAEFEYSVYEIRMNIARSGLFTREQLRDLRMTEHELEVNERSFYNIRPKRCDCDFGEATLTDYETSLLRYATDPDVITDVEKDFILGKPVRTGFRLRSKEAIRLRRRKWALKQAPTLVPFFEPVREVIPTPHPEVIKFLPVLGVVNEAPIKLSFKTDLCLRPKNRIIRAAHPKFGGKKASFISKKSLSSSPPKGSNKKYCYFFRKMACWRPSAHHPKDGEFITAKL
jgi:hypothetical protein